MQHSKEFILDSAYLLPYFKTVFKGVHTILLHIIPACTALYSTHRCIECNHISYSCMSCILGWRPFITFIYWI